MTFSLSVDIKCPVKLAFDTLADVRNETDWNSQVSEATLVSSVPVHRFRGKLSSGCGVRLPAQGLVKVVFPLLSPMIKRDLPKQAQSFAHLCESRT